MANAAVVGMSRWLRYVLLTDALLRCLSPDEIAAVVRHEVAHLRRWHLQLRLALLALPLAVWLAAKHRWPWLELAHSSSIAALGPPLAMLAYAVIIVGRYSRLLEHDADLDACLSHDGRVDPQFADDFHRALCAVCDSDQAGSWAEWLHPSLTARLDFLYRAAHEPSHAVRFRRGLALLATAIIACYLLVAISFAL